MATRSASSRSIPACAGEPTSNIRNGRKARVYPRLCGGTDREKPSDSADSGLSPPVRGNLDPAANRRQREGSIPACAGEPATTTPPTSSQRVYPRLCGGTQPAAGGGGRYRGLSPPVRGNLPFRPFDCPPVRSIPACAGEPYATAAAGNGATVYPRLCGGTDSWMYPLWGRGGLSPPVRGNPALDCRGAPVNRSIPACAGEPW